MKFADAEIMGMPTIVVVGRGLADGVIELRDRRTGERTDVPVDDALGVIIAAVHGKPLAPDPVDLPALTVALLVTAALAAGWIDAVVGGGGLIQLPALLIALPDSTPPATILGTNKVSSVWGTATSSITYALKIKPDWRTIIPLVVASACGSVMRGPAGSLPPEGATSPRSCSIALVGRRDLHLAAAPARAGARSASTMAGRTTAARRRSGSASARTTASSGRAPARSS